MQLILFGYSLGEKWSLSNMFFLINLYVDIEKLSATKYKKIKYENEHTLIYIKHNNIYYQLWFSHYIYWFPSLELHSICN